MPHGRSVVPLIVATAVLGACGDDRGNPFDQVSIARPPSENAAILYVSGAWAESPGAPRELYAASADGTEIERLTSCTRLDPPCDFLNLSTSPIRERIAAVRTTPTAEPGTAALYFMDLGRSVETILTDQRRIGSADWSVGGSLILFSAVNLMGDEDLYRMLPDGTNEQRVIGEPNVRERSPRLEPSGVTAVFEIISSAGYGSVAILVPGPEGPTSELLTPGGDPAQPLAGTSYFVGSDADPAFSYDSRSIIFRRLTSTGNGGYGTWDLYVSDSTDVDPVPLVAGGGVYRGAPDWGPEGITFVEVDAAASEARLVVVQPDGSGRTVLHVEDAGYRMAAPRWLQ